MRPPPAPPLPHGPLVRAEPEGRVSDEDNIPALAAVAAVRAALAELLAPEVDGAPVAARSWTSQGQH